MVNKIVIFLIACYICILPVTSLNITASSIGTTFITWNWDAGTNTTALYIDGYPLCGYDTEIPSVDVLGFTPGSCHNISVTIDNPVETAEDLSCTEYLQVAASAGQSVGNTDNGMGIGTNAIIFGLIGALVGGVVILGKFMKRE